MEEGWEEREEGRRRVHALVAPPKSVGPHPPLMKRGLVSGFRHEKWVVP